MFLLIDNYDSFTYNLWHYLGELGASVEVRRNDAITVTDAMAMGLEGVIISPGPRAPEQAGICLEMIAAAAERRLPLMGVCLGHQSIGQSFGAKIVRAPKPMHGKLSPIDHDAKGVFATLPSPLTATRYHSLTIDPESMPDCLEISARSEDGVIQGVRHRELPIHGVQFHPESIESEYGHDILRNFIDICHQSAAA